VIRNQYPTLIGQTRLGGLEHSEDFTADRHRRAAERWPKAQVSIYPALDLSSLDADSLSLSSHSAPSLERFRERVVRIKRQIRVERP
jgi:hypothetical protein